MGSSRVCLSLKDFRQEGRGEEKSFHQSFGRAGAHSRLCHRAVHSQTPMPAALLGAQHPETHFWCHLARAGAAGRFGLGEVQRWAVIYAHGREAPKHPVFMASPLARSPFPPHVTSCLLRLGALWGQGLSFSLVPGCFPPCPGTQSSKTHEERGEFGAGGRSRAGLVPVRFPEPPLGSLAWLVSLGSK